MSKAEFPQALQEGKRGLPLLSTEWHAVVGSYLPCNCSQRACPAFGFLGGVRRGSFKKEVMVYCINGV